MYMKYIKNINEFFSFFNDESINNVINDIFYKIESWETDESIHQMNMVK
jgi:hypothetical protein